MDNIDFSGVFDTEGVETEVADPAETDDKGDTEQDPAETATETGEGDKGQSAEENAAFAKIRRKYEAEKKEALEKAKKEFSVNTENELNAQISAMGMTDPYSGKQISNAAELKAYNERKTNEVQEALKAELTSKGVTEEQIKNLIENHPDVLAAKKAQSELETLRQREQTEEFTRKIGEELAEIEKLDPSIKGIDDLKKSKDFEQVTEKLKRGYTLADAFYLVHRDQIVGDTAKKVEQAARNNINSKEHLRSSKQEGEGGIEVPSEEFSLYKKLLPDATNDEIQASYQRYKKSQKKKG